MFEKPDLKMKLILKHQLILGSKSPRREKLLNHMGIKFKVRNLPLDESLPANLKVNHAAVYLARKKARAMRNSIRNEILLTADTTVVLDNQILDKPSSSKEAADLLHKLSGRAHDVITGICLYHKGRYHTAYDRTRVFFRKLTAGEISYYTGKYKPFDKAGGYGIQEWIGLVAIDKIEGSYFNVMGLPVTKVYRLLRRLDLLEIK